MRVGSGHDKYSMKKMLEDLLDAVDREDLPGYDAADDVDDERELVDTPIFEEGWFNLAVDVDR